MGRRKDSNWLVKALATACGAISIALMIYANTYAYEVVTDVVPTGNEFSTGTDLRCEWYDKASGTRATTSGSSYSECQPEKKYTGDLVFLDAIYKETPISATEGMYYVFRIQYQSDVQNESVGWSWQTINEENWELITANETIKDGIWNYDANAVGRYTSQTYEFVLRARKTGVFQIGLKSKASMAIFYSNGYYTVTSIVEYEMSAGTEQRKEEEAGNNAVDAADNESNSSEVDTGDAKLQLDVLSQLVKTAGGSCSLGEIEAYGFNIGEIDMCTYTPPDWTRTAVSAVTSLALIYGYLHAFRRIIDTVIKGYTR